MASNLVSNEAVEEFLATNEVVEETPVSDEMEKEFLVGVEVGEEKLFAESEFAVDEEDDWFKDDALLDVMFLT